MDDNCNDPQDIQQHDLRKLHFLRTFIAKLADLGVAPRASTLNSLEIFSINTPQVIVPTLSRQDHCALVFSFYKCCLKSARPKHFATSTNKPEKSEN